MAAQQGEEFELVLGNRQLLSLFFVVVVFFAAFFVVGYFVGVDHGESSRPDPQSATPAEPRPDEAQRDEVRLPDRLLQPAESEAAEAKPDIEKPVKAEPTPREEPQRTAVVTEKPKPTPPPAAKPEPKREPPPKPEPKPEPKTPLTQPRPAIAAAPATSGTFNLQVAAVRVEQDARMLAGKLKDRGYPAYVTDDKGDGWHRVMVGPFQTRDQANGMKNKLNDDGFDTMLRQL